MSRFLFSPLPCILLLMSIGATVLAQETDRIQAGQDSEIRVISLGKLDAAACGDQLSRRFPGLAFNADTKSNTLAIRCNDEVKWDEISAFLKKAHSDQGAHPQSGRIGPQRLALQRDRAGENERLMLIERKGSQPHFTAPLAPPTERRLVKSFSFVQVDAEVCARILTTLFDDVKVAPFAPGRLVFVSGTEEQMLEVEAVILQLEKPN